MSQVNKTVKQAEVTHEGGKAVGNTPIAELFRTVTTCLLWEDNFYEDGVSVSDRIRALVPKAPAEQVALLAKQTRNEFYLRHVPLLIAREMARAGVTHRTMVRELLPEIIRRPDELNEFLSIYWATNNGKKTMSAQVKRGLAAAFNNFETFQLAKYDNKEKEVRIRDVMFMSHPRPKDVPKSHRWGRGARLHDYKNGAKRSVPFSKHEEKQFLVAQDLLKHADTWEARMANGEKPKEVFTDLMERSELGALAFIRNIRKMTESGVDTELIKKYSTVVSLRGVLPHQLITAARYNVGMESMFDGMLFRAVQGMAKLPGRTALLIDVSGSMDDELVKNEAAVSHRRYKAAKTGAPVRMTTRIDAASAVAVMARELCDSVAVWTFSSDIKAVPDRRGMALCEAIDKSQTHGSTYLAKAVRALNDREKYDRIIVITDEQSHDGNAAPLKGTHAYMMNVAPYQNGVSKAGGWISISGWSPQVLRYIAVLEGLDTLAAR